MQGVRDASGLTFFHEGSHFLILRENQGTLEVVEILHGRMSLDEHLGGWQRKVISSVLALERRRHPGYGVGERVMRTARFVAATPAPFVVALTSHRALRQIWPPNEDDACGEQAPEIGSAKDDDEGARESRADVGSDPEPEARDGRIHERGARPEQGDLSGCARRARAPGGNRDLHGMTAGTSRSGEENGQGGQGKSGDGGCRVLRSERLDGVDVDGVSDDIDCRW